MAAESVENWLVPTCERWNAIPDGPLGDAISQKKQKHRIRVNDSVWYGATIAALEFLVNLVYPSDQRKRVTLFDACRAFLVRDARYDVRRRRLPAPSSQLDCSELLAAMPVRKMSNQLRKANQKLMDRLAGAELLLMNDAPAAIMGRLGLDDYFDERTMRRIRDETRPVLNQALALRNTLMRGGGGRAEAAFEKLGCHYFTHVTNPPVGLMFVAFVRAPGWILSIVDAKRLN